MTVQPQLGSGRGLRAADGVGDAVRFALGVMALGAAVFVAAAVWMGTCTGATADAVACGAPQQTLLAFAAPGIFAAGGLWAFVRTHQNRHRQEAVLAWQVVKWLLLTLALFVAALNLA